MGRSPCCSKEGLNRGAWTAHEDQILTDYIKAHGEGRWKNLPQRAGLKRCGKSCRLRWLNYLRPDIKRGNISPDEEELIIRLHKLLGNRWSLIAGRLPGRTDNEIKNYWNTNLCKRLGDHKSPASSGKQNWKKNEIKPPSTTVSEGQVKRDESQVVRTRAIRCTKVFINPEQPLPVKDEPISDMNNRETAGPSINGTVRSNTSTDGLSSSFPGEDNNTLDFLLDFNVGEFCLSDLLNTDSSDFGNLSYSIRNDNGNDLSPSSEQPVIFSDEMFQDWANGDGVQTNEGLSLHSFSPFLQYGGDWVENN
ncbi:hypothetical protein SLE2022_162580 [Rubroshorea leprosula]